MAKYNKKNDEVRYAIQTWDDVSYSNIGLVLKLGEKVENYYKVIEGHCDIVREDCVRFISEDAYNLFKGRNISMTEWQKATEANDSSQSPIPKGESVELKSLIGKHQLSGVEFSDEKIYFHGDKVNYEDCQVMRFCLDGKTYTVVEDPSDGYRSSMRDIFVSNDKIKNSFSPVEVLGMMKDGGTYSNNDTIQFYDTTTSKLVLEAGTDNHDDYYPTFVARFTPENMICNQNKN